ncbi:hypothetical protein VP1G_01957 [Cytospora mali]|uniref:F-box domain-containing protein n=1 Tax=Cytospora mali TaxID=578113 RepID=A0A194USB6_CYTMA|nr:hypothetical protein VP1G_01957 [Valsa mali var. pyri (nom. inval.)]
MPVTTHSQVCLSSISLFRLPREVRASVFKFVLSSLRSTPWDPRGNKFPGDVFPLNKRDAGALMGCSPAYMGVLLSCKELHDEAASILYNTVEMDLLDNSEAEKAAFKIGPRNLKYIRHITIEFRHYAGSKAAWHETPEGTLGAWRAAKFLRFLKLAGARLETVTLKAPWHQMECMGGEMFAHAGCISLEPLLKDPYLFSNVKNVIFPDFLALCPMRGNSFLNSPQRNRPLSEEEQDEILSRLRLEREVLDPSKPFQLTAAPFPVGFFVTCNVQESVMSEDTLYLPAEREWNNMVQEHMALLKSCGFV